MPTTTTEYILIYTLSISCRNYVKAYFNGNNRWLMIRRHIFYYHYFVPEEKPLLDTVVQKRVFSNVTYLIQTRLAIFLSFIRYAVKYNDFLFHSMHLYQDNTKDRYLTFYDAINQITFCQEENSSPITKSRYKIDAQLSFHFYFLDMIHFSVFMHQFWNEN